eukprot:TRINITY_DN2606_c0_g1_i1.p1 TRINITY_DN2606_c0_g1~~TRINITY_DN2606_c0_g1_i1.p1  ORF type:complete len:391 (-),score=107.59 TRINITY_DN2606_c0_g1_i1:119-1291(-)
MTTKVRASKFRHVFGTPAQQAECFAGIKLGSASPESYFLKASPSYFAFPYIQPGTICVVPLSQKGALPEDELPVIEVGDAVNDYNFNPFKEELLTVASQDPEVKVFEIPAGGLKTPLSVPITSLPGHTKRLVLADFHPLASDLLVSHSADLDVKLWDLAAEKEILTAPKVHKQLVTSIAWNLDGSLMATACKDKNLRIIDPRGNSVVSEVADHQGAKSGRVNWATNKDLIITVGFAKNNDKEIALYDPKNLSKRLSTLKVDQSPSSPMVFYDPDTSLIFLAGKGDSTIRMFEVDNTGVYYLNEYKSTSAQNGMAAIPKWNCNVLKCEVFKVLKLTTSSVIPIRFEVPRQNYDQFQEDLFPPTWDGKPTVTAGQWASGVSNPPNTYSLKPK